MRLAALILSILFGVATVSVADAAPKKAAKPAKEEDLNANGKKLMMDGLPLVMPSAVMFWMLHNKEMEAKEAAAKKQAKPKMARAAKAKAAKPAQ
jgi:hypothetical protein